jgi:hypothetical protein
VSPNIRVDPEVFRALQAQAEPLVDSPNSVLRRVLGLDANGHQQAVDEGARDAKVRRDMPETDAERGGRRDPLAWILGRDAQPPPPPAA